MLTSKPFADWILEGDRYEEVEIPYELESQKEALFSLLPVVKVLLESSLLVTFKIELSRTWLVEDKGGG